MLDAVIEFLPSPIDIPPVPRPRRRRQAEVVRHADDNEKFSALAFKMMTDPFVGQLTFVRVYSGMLKSGDTVYNPINGKKERIGRILQMHANQREEIKEILRRRHRRLRRPERCDHRRNAVRSGRRSSRSKRMVFPEPVISQAVEPKTKADQEKMGIALSRLAQEDPSFRVRTDEESGQTIISGMGELHLEIIVDRMKREFGVEATVGKPQVAYRETIRKTAKSRRQVRQAVGRPWPVRSRRAEDRAARAGQGLRVRRRDQGRCGSARIHPCGRRRVSRHAAERRAGRLPGGRRQGHAVLRFVPRRRLERKRVQDGRFDGLQGRLPQGLARSSWSR